MDDDRGGLVLTVKSGESINIGEDVVICLWKDVWKDERGDIKVRIKAPAEMKIIRNGRKSEEVRQNA